MVLQMDAQFDASLSLVLNQWFAIYLGLNKSVAAEPELQFASRKVKKVYPFLGGKTIQFANATQQVNL